MRLTDQSLSIWATTADAARAAQQAGGQIPPLAREIELRSCVAALTALLDKMNDSEDDLLRTRSATARESGARAISVVLLGGGFSTFVVLLAIGILRRDLAEKRRAEEALRKRETDLRDAQRVASVGSWEWMIDSATIYLVRRALPYRRPRPQSTSPTLQDMPQRLTPQSWSELKPAMDLAVKAGTPTNSTLR